MSAQDEMRLKEVHKLLKEKAPQNPDVAYEDKIPTDWLISEWISEYERLTGTRPIYAKDLVSLLRDYGSNLSALLERPIRIGVTGYSEKQFDKAAAQKLIESIIQQLKAEGVALADASIISGLTNLGVVEASYGAAKKYPDIETQGVASSNAIFFETAPVDKVVLVGNQWGAESPVFLNTINFLVGIGGGGQAEKELRWFISRQGEGALLAEGFFGTKKDGTKVPGAVDKIEPKAGGTRFSRADEQPEYMGREIGKTISRLVREERYRVLDSPLLKLAIQATPDQILDVEQWAKANTARYRIIRILNAGKKKLQAKSLSQAEINEALASASTEILLRTAGIDNLKDNSVWQSKVKAFQPLI
jgi:hypothetical protein